MAEVVTGQIGNDRVHLENAASEATLLLLLAEFRKLSKQQGGGASNNATTEALQELATQAGHAAETVDLLSTAVNFAGKTFGFVTGLTKDLGGAFQGVIGFANAIANNEGKASKVFDELGKLPFGIGELMQGFAMLQRIQEEQLVAYQKLSVAGASLGGNLDQIRMSAFSLNLTLDQFASIVAKSGQQLATLGGNTETGLQSFIRLGRELNNGAIGSGLRGLGYTSEQINEHMLNYIAMTGGRSKDELKNTRQITEQTGAYLRQLDRLAQITGQSREELEKKMQKETMDANFQLFLSQQDATTREKMANAVARYTALYGAAGADIAKATLLHTAVVGEAGQQMVAFMGPTASLIQQGVQAEVAGAKKAELDEIEIKSRLATQAAANRIPATLNMYTDQTNQLADAYRVAQMENLRKSGDVEGAKRLQAQIELEQGKRGASQAAAQADKQVQMLKMASAAMSALLEIARKLNPAMNEILKYMLKFVNWLAFTALPQLEQWVKEIQAWWNGPQGQKFKKAFDDVGTILKEKVLPPLEVFGEWLLDHPNALIATTAALLAFKAGLFDVPGLIMKGFLTGVGSSIATKMFSGKGAATAAAGAAEASGPGLGVLEQLGRSFAKAGDWLLKGAAIGASLWAIGKGLGVAAEGIKKFQGIDWKTLGEAGATLGGIMAAIFALGEIMKDGGIVDIALGEAAIAGLGLAIGMFPVATLKALGDLLSTVLHAIGDSLVTLLNGIAGALQSVGKTIGDLLLTLVESIKRLGNVDAGGIIKVSVALYALAPALALFGVGSVVAGVLNWFSGGLEPVARGLSSLAAVNTTNLGNVARGITDFVNNLPGFWTSLGAAAKISDFGESFTPLADNLTKMSKLNPAMFIIVNSLIVTWTNSKLTDKGLTIFTDNQVKLMQIFAGLNFTPRINELIKLKDLAINDMPKASLAIDEFADKLDRILAIDVSKLKNLSDGLANLKTVMTSTQNTTPQVVNILQGLLGQVPTGTTSTPTAPTTTVTAEEYKIPELRDANSIMQKELADLNTGIRQLINLAGNVSDNTRKMAQAHNIW